MIILGTVSAILVAPHAETLCSERVPHVVVSLEGFAGDRHSGLTCRAAGRSHHDRDALIRNVRQVSIVSEEELAAIARALKVPRILPEWLGANLLVRGVPDLTHLPASSGLQFPDGTSLVVYKENKPCRAPGRIIQAEFPGTGGLIDGFKRAADGLRGLVAWVEHPGSIGVGDEMRVEVATPAHYAGTGDAN